MIKFVQIVINFIQLDSSDDFIGEIYSTNTKTMKIIALFLLMVLLAPSLHSAEVSEDDFPFVRINRSNSRISYDGISDIFQDSRGLLWIGTFKGLNRYDGDRFTVYDKDDLGVPSDFIHCLEEDCNGNIWVGTDRGVVIYDYSHDSFVSFDNVSNQGTVIDNKVNNIKLVGRKMWLTVNHQGMFSYDLDSKELINYFFKDGMQTLPQGIRRFLVDNNGVFWLGLYYNDFYRASPDLDSLVSMSSGQDGFSFVDDNVEGLALSRKNGHIIYVLTVRHGLCEMDTKHGTVNPLLKFPDDAVPIELCLDPGKCIWIATTKGLYRYDLIDGSHIVLREDENNRFALSDDYVFSVTVDNEGGIWVGTKDGGLNYSGPDHKNFTKYYAADSRSLENAIVSGFANDGNGNIWVATEKEGLFRYDLETERLNSYDKVDFKETICSPCFYDGYLWLGSLNGLIRLELHTGQVRRYTSFATALVEDNKCFVLYAADSGYLYVGTTLGLMKYNKDTDSFVSIPEFEGKFITGIDEDSRGYMWVSTYADGVYYFDPSGAEPLACYQYPDGLPTNKLSGIFVDGRDRVWAVGFSFGFFRYDRSKDAFMHFSRKNIQDLPTDVFFSAMDDRDGNLWLSSDVGMVRFNPENNEVASYTESSGILDDMMKKGVARDSLGYMYFGSQNGFIRFNPEKFYVGTAAPNIVLTDFRVGDKIVKPGPGSPLDCNVDIEDEIILKHGQNSFGLSVSVLSMSARSSNKIMCLLEGYDTSPRTLSADKSVFWYNVPAGTYNLKVWGSNVNGRWNVNHSPIKITVEQPLWATPWAIAIYVIVLLIMVFVSVRLYVHRMKKKEKERLEAFESEMEIRVLSDNLPTALLIADDADVRLQVKKCVEQECNVVSVMTAKRGFVILETVKINLIIADIDTRHFAGEEFCTQIKAHKGYSRIPIMILSSDTSTKRKISYMDKGVSLFVEKPLSDDYLQSAIRNIFNKEMSIESAISQSIVSMKIHRLKLDSRDEDFLNLLDKTIMDNLGNPDFDSDALEKAMSMSRSSLVRRMKALLDTTPNEYLKKRRLSVAAAMLLENNVRVNEICYAVGFRYPSYFTKCFKEAYGVIPAEYSKKCSKNI